MKGFVKNIFYGSPWLIEICNATIHTNWKHCVWWGFILYPSSLVVVQHIHLASINCNAKPFIPKMWWCAIYCLQLNLGSHEESFDKVYSPFHPWSFTFFHLFAFVRTIVVDIYVAWRIVDKTNERMYGDNNTMGDKCCW